jgi:proline iminopeptidase
MKIPLPFTLLSVILFSCNQPQKSNPIAETSNPQDSSYEVKVGGNKMILVDGKYHVWTKKIGDGRMF